MSYEMELRLGPHEDPDRSQWHMVYRSGGNEQVRPYELVVEDASRGAYLIDEKNSIVLEAHYVNETLYQVFEIEGVLLHVRSHREGEEIEFEITSFDTEGPRETGGEESVSKVTSYLMKTLQRSVLKRQ